MRALFKILGGGAWPFLVGGGFVWLIPITNETSTCHTTTVDENRQAFYEGLTGVTSRKFEAITGL